MSNAGNPLRTSSIVMTLLGWGLVLLVVAVIAYPPGFMWGAHPPGFPFVGPAHGPSPTMACTPICSCWSRCTWPTGSC